MRFRINCWTYIGVTTVGNSRNTFSHTDIWSRALCVSFPCTGYSFAVSLWHAGKYSTDIYYCYLSLAVSEAPTVNISLQRRVINNTDHVKRSERRRAIDIQFPAFHFLFFFVFIWNSTLYLDLVYFTIENHLEYYSTGGNLQLDHCGGRKRLTVLSPWWQVSPQCTGGLPAYTWTATPWQTEREKMNNSTFIHSS